MSQGTKLIHSLRKLSTAANVPAAIIEKGQNRVIDASLTLIRERAKLKVHMIFFFGGNFILQSFVFEAHLLLNLQTFYELCKLFFLPTLLFLCIC